MGQIALDIMHRVIHEEDQRGFYLACGEIVFIAFIVAAMGALLARFR